VKKLTVIVFALGAAPVVVAMMVHLWSDVQRGEWGCVIKLAVIVAVGSVLGWWIERDAQKTLNEP
jgi:MFS superfamily sulfate permease-like transporter